MKIYKILSGDTQENLADEVNIAINEGWELLGGVSAACSTYKNESEGWWDTSWEYNQAVIKETYV